MNPHSPHLSLALGDYWGGVVTTFLTTVWIYSAIAASNASAWTLTQHAQRGSMAAQCLWLGIDASLASKHITAKGRMPRPFAVYQDVFQIRTHQNSHIFQRFKNGLILLMRQRRPVVAHFALVCCKHARVKQRRIEPLQELESRRSSQPYNLFSLPLGHCGELYRTAPSVAHIGNDIFRALRHPAVAPVNCVAGMDELQPFREHHATKVGSGVLRQIRELKAVTNVQLTEYAAHPGLTQEQLVERVGIRRQHLGAIEAPNLVSPISLELLLNIADVLNVPLYRLLRLREVAIAPFLKL